MKIVAEHLISHVRRNGPDKYTVISKVVELENGKFYFEVPIPGMGYDYKLCTYDLKDPFFDEGL